MHAQTQRARERERERENETGVSFMTFYTTREFLHTRIILLAEMRLGSTAMDKNESLTQLCAPTGVINYMGKFSSWIELEDCCGAAGRRLYCCFVHLSYAILFACLYRHSL
jgi:hypothetical protein